MEHIILGRRLNKHNLEGQHEYLTTEIFVPNKGSAAIGKVEGSRKATMKTFLRFFC